ncbi:TPA: TIR domain-containing protein, partial [Candidatus Poribacteria bacterium]|nr:TIR domain-containing protein [Candidatus Poribacteria bacterium]
MRHACFNSLGWQDIPPTSEWLDEVYAGIQAADTFLFIISPDSVVSEICTLETEHAIQHNKRLVPVVWHDVADDQVHSAMSAHNWVFLREEDDFDANFELLIDALDTDLEHVREHTRLLTRAIEWDQDEQSKGLALSRQELTMAEGWLTQGVSKEPRPAELHSEYIAFSRATVAGWRKLIISSVAVAVIFLSGLSVFS